MRLVLIAVVQIEDGKWFKLNCCLNVHSIQSNGDRFLKVIKGGLSFLSFKGARCKVFEFE